MDSKEEKAPRKIVILREEIARLIRENSKKLIKAVNRRVRDEKKKLS